MARLVVDAVRFAYGPREILKGVSLEVAPGRTVAVVGPNGAGKSTLLRVAAGLLSPGGGRVTVDGDDVHHLERRVAARRIAALAAEEPTTFPFTVRDAVALGRHPWRGRFGRLTPADDAAVAEALALFDLDALADRALPTLSSGERQRVALARCLAQGGEVVLLDEPTSHLDVGHRVRAVEAFARRAEARGQALMAVLHDLNLAAQADEVVLLVGGAVAAAGPPSEVLAPGILQAAFGVGLEVVAGPLGPVVVPRPRAGADQGPRS